MQLIVYNYYNGNVEKNEPAKRLDGQLNQATRNPQETLYDYQEDER